MALVDFAAPLEHLGARRIRAPFGPAPECEPALAPGDGVVQHKTLDVRRCDPQAEAPELVVVVDVVARRRGFAALTARWVMFIGLPPSPRPASVSGCVRPVSDAGVFSLCFYCPPVTAKNPGKPLKQGVKVVSAVGIEPTTY